MTEENSRLFGHLKKLRIISQYGSYWNRLEAYEESEQRITINNKGKVWITRYYRAPYMLNADQLLSKEYLRVSPEATIRIMKTAEDCFVHYEHETIHDAQMWYAYLTNTDGIEFATDGSVDQEKEAGMYRLTEVIQKELGKTDLLVLGTYIEDYDEEEPVIDQQAISFEELMQRAEESIHADRDQRIGIYRALEKCFFECGYDEENRMILYRMMDRYVTSLEAENPLKQSKKRTT